LAIATRCHKIVAAIVTIASAKNYFREAGAFAPPIRASGIRAGGVDIAI
jgi:hypothetical protein